MKSWNENSVWQEMAKLTNISLEFNTPPLGQEQEQFNLIVASGNYPDFIWTDGITYPGGADKAIADGSFLKLNDLIDQYAPNYKKLINSTETFRKETMTDEGNIWGFGMVENKIQGAWLGMVVRRDWLDDLGMAVPETFDEWEAMLTAFKTEKGCEYPLLLSKTGVESDESLIAGFGVGGSFYQIDGKAKYGPIEPGYKEYIEKMYQWYSLGLIDKDFSSRDGTQTENFIVTDQTGAWRDGFYMLDNYVKKAQNSKFHLTAIATPVKNKGDVAHLRQTNFNVRGLYMAISCDCKYPKEAVQFMDYLYSDTGYLLANYGIENEAYTMVNGEPQYTDLMTKNPDGLNTTEAQNKYALQQGPMNRIWWREMFTYGKDAQECESIWGKAQSDYVMPLITMTADEGNRYATIMGDINTYVSENRVKFIMGVEPMSKYEDFVAQIKKMGIDEVIAIQQAALDRYNTRK
ncbi:MAG: extracellular solute-binding protein [Clostridiaceae bacterium]|nr:extracellular solute-binding protein [Clostridiaceae bacterium]